MPHELPKSYEPGAIETRWAEYWVTERLFSAPTPEPESLALVGSGLLAVAGFARRRLLA